MKRKPQHRYSTDKPITRLPEDQLGRTGFAKRLAEDIGAWEGSDSLVIALYGDWGSGKTSLKNLTLASLAKRRKKIPTVEFSPWQLSGTGSIATAFFEELRIALQPKAGDSSQEATERAKRLSAYAKRLSLGSWVAKAFGGLFAASGHVDAGISAAAVGEGLGQAAEVSRAGGEAIEATAGFEDLPLNLLKNSLADSLRKLQQPLLVVIDDIDRLTTREILDVFQLVKANADFPNVIYLLLFERSIVCKALDQVSDGRGGEFLEKIVQVGYHVPHASRGAVQKALFRGLDEHLALPGVDRRWSAERWSELFLDGLSPFFRNLRHVYRFLSSFDFHVRQFQSGNNFEVNPVDLVGLEALRVFEPNVFERLALAKRILTRDSGPGLLDKIEQHTVDSVVTDILTSATEARKENVRRILHQLFPPVSSSYAGDGGTSRDTNHWLRDARICHPDCFDQYFSLSTQEGDVPQSELDRLVDSAGDRETFTKLMRAIEHRGLTMTAFERLDAHKEEIPLERMPTLIQALCDLSDTFPTKGIGMFQLDVRMMAARLIYFGLRRDEDEHRRFEILRDAFTSSHGVLLPVFVTCLQQREPGTERESTCLVSEQDWEALKEISLQKIRQASADGRLKSHPQPATLLWRWSDWAPDEARVWVAKQVTSAQGAVWLLSVLLGEVHEHGKKLTVRHYFKLSNLERFTDVETVQKSVADLPDGKATERERIALREFQRAIQRRAEGKPESDGW